MYIHVKAAAGQKEEDVRRISADHYEIWVKEKARGNAANGRIVRILRGLYPGQTVRLINGHHSPSKLFAVGD